MAGGLSGQDRSPRAPVRERRNFDNLASVLEFIGLAEVIQINGSGELTLALATDGGLENDSAALTIKLNPTDPGLVLAAAGLSVAVQGVLDIDGAGVFLNFGNGLENNAGSLDVALATNSGLSFAAGDLTLDLDTDPGLVLGAGGVAVQLDGTSLTLGASGLSVTDRAGRQSVTAVQTGAYTAAWGETVRADPSGGGFTVTLPTAAGNAGRRITVKNTTSSTNAITIDADGSETIDGAADATISTANGSLTFESDGTNVMVVGAV